MMFCWQIRRELTDHKKAGRSRVVRLHLELCAVCRAEAESQESIAALVSDAGNLNESIKARFDAIPFEQRVMAGLKERLDGSSPPVLNDPLGVTPRIPFHWAAAAAVMILVTVTAIFVGQGSPGIFTEGRATDFVAEARTSGPYYPTDNVIPPPDIPFVLRQDLAGARTGRMPVTTFVLEPAPEENSVVRASF